MNTPLSITTAEYLQDPSDPYANEYDDEVILLITDQLDIPGEEELVGLQMVRPDCICLLEGDRVTVVAWEHALHQHNIGKEGGTPRTMCCMRLNIYISTDYSTSQTL